MTGAGAEPVQAGGRSAARSRPGRPSVGLYLRVASPRQAALCRVNGVMTLISYQATQNVMYAKDMPDAVRDDLSTIRTNTQVISPTVVMVHGMESESGFVELVHRVGDRKARSARFGKGFDVWNAATTRILMPCRRTRSAALRIGFTSCSVTSRDSTDRTGTAVVRHADANTPTPSAAVAEHSRPRLWCRVGYGTRRASAVVRRLLFFGDGR